MFQEEADVKVMNGLPHLPERSFDHPANKGVFVSHHSLFFFNDTQQFFVVYKHII
jgi:hypothetical protein